jgi:hypothetical protein
MARSKGASACWLETSAVIYHLHGHSLQQAAVHEAVAERRVEVPVFVRMEYVRGVLLNLIEMYGLLKESRSVQDALIDWSQKVKQERKLKVVLLTAAQWLTSHDEYLEKERTLRRLGDLIFREFHRFDESFQRPATDRLACELGRPTVSQPDFDEDLLLDFYDRCRAILEGKPHCRLCAFRQVQQRRLRRSAINLTTPLVRSRYVGNPGFLIQTDRLVEAGAHRGQSPACRWCERLGDALIALQLPPHVVLITADRTFLPFGELLGRPIQLLPSLAELKRRSQTV